ncbi:MAG: D-glycero-beta-D-manno-heptose 1-phosphate adenylyltransferase [Bacteroidota bacterium]|nr:D-glycero-beta-D-manno-heptose 1-phosphate adenylyltransferase [Bacteroidota bacterium]
MIEQVKAKILDNKRLEGILELLKIKGKTIVFTNGCFDLLHQGHIDYLARTKDLADVLIVGLNTDTSIKRIKGEKRPIQDENSRAIIMASLCFVDYVVLFEEDTPYNLIKTIQPNVLVKGADYKQEEIVGYDIVKAKGGKVKTLEYLQNHSTTNIINKIRQS